MKSYIISLGLLMFSAVGIVQAAERGVIVYESGDCIVIETSGGFTLAEWYGGTAWKGHEVVGELESYGMTDLFDLNNDSEVSVYVDDYWVSEDEAIEWIRNEGCE